MSARRFRAAGVAHPTHAKGTDADEPAIASCRNRTSRFAAVRVRPAHRDYDRVSPRPEEWCLIEWPKGEAEPTKYWLFTLPADMPLRDLVDLAKLRWRIERDYQELKQELGLGHYEGRGWRGFHHHATLAIAAYGFLISERSAIPPLSQTDLQNASSIPWLPTPRIPRSDLSGTSATLLPRSVWRSPAHWHKLSHDACAASV